MPLSLGNIGFDKKFDKMFDKIFCHFNTTQPTIYGKKTKNDLG